MKIVLLPAAAVLVLLGCANGSSRRDAAEQATGGDAETGRRLIYRYDCGGCHTIPGVAAANGVVGPPLTGFGARSYIAGVLPNTPENLVRWIAEPQRINPDTAMPDLEVGPGQARHMAAYLYTLR